MATHPSSIRRKPRFAVGVAVSVVTVFAAAEIYLQSFPPSDLQPYLGDESALTGIFRPDLTLGVHYKSWQVFHADNQQRLQPFLAPPSASDARPIWAFFGNSFVHAAGMLGDHCQRFVADKRTFYLGRNERFPIRIAQVELLLEQGVKPERIFFSVMPIDCLRLGKQPLDTIRVTPKGAITYEPRQPKGPLGWLVRNSRTFLTGWIRTGQHHGNPQFNRRTINAEIHPVLLGDLKKLLGRLAEITAKHKVPTTILLIPAYQQVMGEEPYGFQDTLTPHLRKMGFDVFDPREAFRRQASPSLFIPDKHFSDQGNRILLDELLQHVRLQNAI